MYFKMLHCTVIQFVENGIWIASLTGKKLSKFNPGTSNSHRRSMPRQCGLLNGSGSWLAVPCVMDRRFFRVGCMAKKVEIKNVNKHLSCIKKHTGPRKVQIGSKVKEKASQWRHRFPACLKKNRGSSFPQHIRAYQNKRHLSRDDFYNLCVSSCLKHRGCAAIHFNVQKHSCWLKHKTTNNRAHGTAHFITMDCLRVSQSQEPNTQVAPQLSGRKKRCMSQGFRRFCIK